MACGHALHDGLAVIFDPTHSLSAGEIGAPFVCQPIERTGATDLDDQAPIERSMNKDSAGSLSDFCQLLRAHLGLRREVSAEVFNFGNGVAS